MIRIRNNGMHNGQSILEFSFTLVVAMLMLWGTMMVFRWVGVDLSERRIAHDEGLTQVVAGSVYIPQAANTFTYSPYVLRQTYNEGPARQVHPVFHEPVKIDAVWNGF